MSYRLAQRAAIDRASIQGGLSPLASGEQRHCQACHCDAWRALPDGAVHGRRAPAIAWGERPAGPGRPSPVPSHKHGLKVNCPLRSRRKLSQEASLKEPARQRRANANSQFQDAARRTWTKGQHPAAEAPSALGSAFGFCLGKADSNSEPSRTARNPSKRIMPASLTFRATATGPVNCAAVIEEGRQRWPCQR